MIETFAEWLYISKLPAEPIKVFFDIWGFGTILGAPKFENAAIKRLVLEVSRSRDKKDVQYWAELGFANSEEIQENINDLWKAADFSPDRAEGLDLSKGEAFWGNKKRLLFLLDTAAWQGLDNSGVRDVIRAGGDQAVILLQKMLHVATRRITGPPWASHNIDKYPSDETNA
jgi:hypothetical protein